MTDMTSSGIGLKPADLLYRHRVAVLCLILVVAALLRFGDIGAQPIWVDEAYSLYFSDQSFRHLWVELPAYENHPPLYFVILKAWRLVAGSSEAAIRFPSALASFGTVCLVFVAGRTLGRATAAPRPDLVDARGWAFGLMAAALAAVAQLQLAYADEARPYTFCAFATALMMVGALRFLCLPPGARPDLAGAATLAVGMALTLWSHALGLVAAGLTGMTLLVWWWLVRDRDLRLFLWLGGVAIAALLLFAPHLLTIVSQLSRDYSDFWLSRPGILRLAKMSVQATGQPGMPGGIFAAFASTAAALGLGAAGLWRLTSAAAHLRTAGLYLVVMSAGFWLVVVLYSYLAQPVVLPRTLIFMQPAALLIMAAAPWAIAAYRGALAAVLLTLACLGLSGPSGILDFPRPYRDIVAHIAASDAPDAPVLVMPGAAELPLRYYEEQGGVDLNVLPVPGAFPFVVDGRVELVARPQMSETGARALFAELEGEDTVWLVARLAHLYDRERLLEAGLERGWRRTIVSGGAEPRPHIVFSRFDAIP